MFNESPEWDTNKQYNMNTIEVLTILHFFFDLIQI
jgi:hypothetical protein